MLGMEIAEVASHSVAEPRLVQALEDMLGRAVSRWHDMRYGSTPLRQGLRELGEELADHLGARTASDPALCSPGSRAALTTAAECAVGVLDLACFPDGDFEVVLPLPGKVLSSEELHYEVRWEPEHPATTARTWTEAFVWSVVSGLIGNPGRVLGPLLVEDYAPAIRDGVPYSQRMSVSDPADRAEMDTLCAYLSAVKAPSPGRHGGPVALGKPDPAERTRAAGQLDTAGTLTPDQQLLRVLLNDDQAAFEQALQKRLAAHRDSVGTDPAARTLLPTGTIALSALAQQAHGWRLRTRSPYLPQALLGVPRL
jgi:hypothetical protein